MSAQELPATVAQGVSPESTHRPAPSDARPQRPADTHLRLRGLTDDGTRLLLVDAAGLEFDVDVDARLRAALHGDPSRTDPSSSQSTPPRSGPHHSTNREKSMESPLLRPRDIQARIRAGETPEAVAEAAQTTLEKVMPYAAPVLAEREHVAQRSLRASIRRPRPVRPEPQGPAAPSVTPISTRLRGMNVDPDSVVWDAWRREDGRWSLSASFSAGGQDGLARLTYDQPGNFVLLENDEARWLVGDHLERRPGRRAGADAAEPEGRALSAVPSEQLALTAPTTWATDAIELVTTSPSRPTSTSRRPRPPRRSPPSSTSRSIEQPGRAGRRTRPPTSRPPGRRRRRSAPRSRAGTRSCSAARARVEPRLSDR